MYKYKMFVLEQLDICIFKLRSRLFTRTIIIHENLKFKRIVILLIRMEFTLSPFKPTAPGGPVGPLRPSVP